MAVLGNPARRVAVASFERWYLRALLALARRDHAEATIAALKPRLTKADPAHRDLLHEDRLAAIGERLALDTVTADVLAAIAAFAADPPDRSPIPVRAGSGRGRSERACHRTDRPTDSAVFVTAPEPKVVEPDPVCVVPSFLRRTRKSERERATSIVSSQRS